MSFTEQKKGAASLVSQIAVNPFNKMSNPNLSVNQAKYTKTEQKPPAQQKFVQSFQYQNLQNHTLILKQ